MSVPNWAYHWKQLSSIILWIDIYYPLFLFILKMYLLNIKVHEP